MYRWGLIKISNVGFLYKYHFYGHIINPCLHVGSPACLLPPVHHWSTINRTLYSLLKQEQTTDRDQGQLIFKLN